MKRPPVEGSIAKLGAEELATRWHLLLLKPSDNGASSVLIVGKMAEARRLKTGKWKLYKTPDLDPVRDPATGTALTFDSLAAARRWWLNENPGGAAPDEGIKCARCGAYFGRSSSRTLYGGLYYHVSHTPQAADAERRRR